MRSKSRNCLMAGLLAGWLVVCSCGVRKIEEIDRRFMKRDSLSVKRLDYSHATRLWKLDGESVVSREDISLSVPDSNGRQYIAGIRRTVAENRYVRTQKDSLHIQNHREIELSRETDITEQMITTPLKNKQFNRWITMALFVVVAGAIGWGRRRYGGTR